MRHIPGALALLFPLLHLQHIPVLPHPSPRGASWQLLEGQSPWGQRTPFPAWKEQEGCDSLLIFHSKAGTCARTNPFPDCAG